jgi:hypothetical protein
MRVHTDGNVTINQSLRLDNYEKLYLWGSGHDNFIDYRSWTTGSSLNLTIDNTGTGKIELDDDTFIGGELTVGSGSAQKNITLFSPDGTAWTCGVSDAGSFDCS